MNANSDRQFRFDVQTILVRKIESPFATHGYHDIHIGVLCMPIV